MPQIENKNPLTVTSCLKIARRHLLESAELKRRTSEMCLSSIVSAADMITRAFRAGKKILLCGNGGSAADCQHLATEFVSRLTSDFERPGLPAIALTTDTSFLTAYANDCGYEGVFERQVRTLGVAGDVLIGISTSGNSVNVINAFEAARSMGLRTIALTGDSGRLGEIADISIAVPSSNTNHIQEAHLAIEHTLCFLVERLLFPEALNRDASHEDEGELVLVFARQTSNSDLVS
jgi:D-sedoheptulose 7-phosphate isomerase